MINLLNNDSIKKWEKPEMVVLVRNKVDELVLSGCKMSGNSSAGTYVTNCQAYDEDMGSCIAANCNTIGIS